MVLREIREHQRITRLMGRSASDKRADKRLAYFALFMAVLFLVECLGLVYKSALIPGLNREADVFRETGMLRAEGKRMVCGDIVDRNGRMIVHNEFVTEGEGKDKKTYQTSAYLDRYAFTQLVGYTGGGPLIEFTTKIDHEADREIRAFTEERKDYQLMKHLAHGDHNVLYKSENPALYKGSQVMLTIDADFQIWLMDFLKKQIGEGEFGSITVLDAHTGAVIGMAAQPTMSTDENERKEAAEKNNVDAGAYTGLPLTHMWAVRPGSIFKLLTAAALIENGMEDFTASDESFEVNKFAFTNSYEKSKGILDFREGFRYSSNVFFAHAAIELGYDRMTEMVRKFRLDYEKLNGEGTPIELDFGLVSTNWNLEDLGSAGLGYAGFGYGGTELSGVSAAMMMSAFANQGVIMTPHLIRQISDGEENGKVRAEEEISVMAEPISKETADIITEALEYTVEGYISDGKISGSHADLYRKYAIRAKTGTGDVQNLTGRKNVGPNAAWVASYAPGRAAEDEAQYVVIMNHVETSARGSRYLDAVGEVYDYLFTHLEQP